MLRLSNEFAATTTRQRSCCPTGGRSDEATRVHDSARRRGGLAAYRPCATAAVHRRRDAPRDRAQGCGGRGRYGGRPQGRHLSGRVRRRRYRRGPPAAARFDVPDRVDDQGHHFDRGDAAGRAEPLRDRRPGGEISAGIRKAHGLRIVRRRHWRLSAASCDQAGDHPASVHAHVGARLRLHQPDRARLQAAHGRGICGGPAGVRTGRAVALQHQHGLAGPPGREGLRPAARGLLPPTHLHAARDGRHLLLRAEGQGGAAGDGQPPAARRLAGEGLGSSRRHPASRRLAVAACRRPPATTSASRARCSTAASSTAAAFFRPPRSR